MSASERLREISFFAPSTASHWKPQAVLLAALPELIAVVEAAEQGRDHSLLLNSEPAGVEMLGWRVSDAQALQSALAALDDALTTKGER